jgi:hypothetical protein
MNEITVAIMTELHKRFGYPDSSDWKIPVAIYIYDGIINVYCDNEMRAVVYISDNLVRWTGRVLTLITQRMNFDSADPNFDPEELINKIEEFIRNVLKHA